MTEQAAIKKQRQGDADANRTLWEKYEQRKAELTEQGLSPAEYYAACQQIAKELGI